MKGFDMIKKIITGIFATTGVAVFCWGIGISTMAIYYLVTNNIHYGEAAGIGLPYGIVMSGIGLVPIILAVLVYRGVFRQRQILILLMSIFLIGFIWGLENRVLMLDENNKTCTTYSAVMFYGLPLGGEVGMYEKSPSSEKTPRKLIEKYDKGFSRLRSVVPYKFKIAVVILLAGSIMILINRRRS